jgi:3-oxoacyl-[acyl-carrier-protein] synthase II
MKSRIVITGIGPICSLGKGVEQVWQSLINCKISISKFDKYIYGKYPREFLIYKVKNFDIKNYDLDNNLIKEMKDWQNGEEVVDLYYLLAAVKLALIDSNLKNFPSEKTGIILAHENPGLEQFCSYFFTEILKLKKLKKIDKSAAFFDELNFKFASNINDLQTFMLLYYVSRIFDIRGFSLFINNACASGLYAIETASQSIKSGKNKIAVVASSEHPSIYKYLWFERLGFLSKSGRISPFDVNRDGFICGEGGTAIILEEYEHAKKRNAKIYCEYLGGGFNLENWKRTVPRTDIDFRQMALKEAFNESKIHPQDIDVVNTHGIGAKIIDHIEAKAISGYFKNVSNKPLVTAFKPYVGHTLGNSALLETCLGILSMKNNKVIKIPNLNSLDPKIDLNLSLRTSEKRLKTMLKIVWGFGGYNAAGIFRKL